MIKKIFEKAIKEGNLSPYLNEIPVKKGDMFYVKSGLVHAICERCCNLQKFNKIVIQLNRDFMIYNKRRENSCTKSI